MNENYQRILELLNKSTLSLEEKSYLDKMLSSDPEAKALFDTHEKIRGIVKNSSHLSEEEIGSYILKKNNIETQTALLSPFVETHLKECGRCSKLYLELLNEYEELDSFLDNKFSQTSQPAGETKSTNAAVKKNNYKRYSFISLISLVIIIIGLIITSNAVTTKTAKLAEINDNSIYYVTRGRASENFQKGLLSLENKNFDSAVGYFENDIKLNKDEETLFYTHYILGLTFLEDAQTDFIGLFPTYDKGKVQKAIENLETCISKNSSDKFPDITSKSYFYLGKANLMLGKVEDAKKNLNQVIDRKGSKMEEAKQLLDDLR